MTADLTWRKSSYSGGEGGNCIEVAGGLLDSIPVRDSKDPHGPALAFTPEAWRAFIAGIQANGLPINP
ncbi:DUF397 domain-containing protein [Streptomyces sp. CBMA156]|uniref:DUF397 domain-containing protein n=1 Tax=Streptomyces sp. CBMA156 TaxID=1930280 RepID=UPI001661F545|nr:DUF397 domain-containing protein [Streptomyces sp. CBMA156]MBD0672703.1 DUF397 domain-containing protein [Streptomyces sp. CBMA156]